MDFGVVGEATLRVSLTDGIQIQPHAFFVFFSWGEALFLKVDPGSFSGIGALRIMELVLLGPQVPRYRDAQLLLLWWLWI